MVLPWKTKDSPSSLPPSVPSTSSPAAHDVTVAPSSSSSSPPSLLRSLPPSPPFRMYAFDLLTPPQLEDSSFGSSPNIVLSQETWLWQGAEEGGREGGLPPPPLPHKADAVFCGASASAGDVEQQRLQQRRKQQQQQRGRWRGILRRIRSS